jgi:alcohol dehydrogenase
VGPAAETALSVAAAVLEAPERLSLRRFPVPGVGEDNGLLRVELAGVCGTDPKYYAGRLASRTAFPLILGHEAVGRIEAVGPGAAKRWRVAPGQRVVVDSFLACGSCPACRRGDRLACEALRTYGTRISCQEPPHLWGSYGQYMYLDARALVYPVPEHVEPRAALSVCAYLANGIRWAATLGDVRIGMRVLVQPRSLGGPHQGGRARSVSLIGARALSLTRRRTWVGGMLGAARSSRSW